MLWLVLLTPGNVHHVERAPLASNKTSEEPFSGHGYDAGSLTGFLSASEDPSHPAFILRCGATGEKTFLAHTLRVAQLPEIQTASGLTRGAQSLEVEEYLFRAVVLIFEQLCVRYHCGALGGRHVGIRSRRQHACFRLAGSFGHAGALGVDCDQRGQVLG